MNNNYGNQMKILIDLILIKNKKNQKKFGDHGHIKNAKLI